MGHTPNYRLKVLREGSLLSVALDREITPAQYSILLAVLKAPDLTYGEVLQFLAVRLQPNSWTTETVYRNKEDVPA